MLAQISAISQLSLAWKNHHNLGPIANFKIFIKDPYTSKWEYHLWSSCEKSSISWFNMHMWSVATLLSHTRLAWFIYKSLKHNTNKQKQWLQNPVFGNKQTNTSRDFKL